MDEMLKAATITIMVFNHKEQLAEYEMLAYEQACRCVEVVMRQYRELLEKSMKEQERCP